MQLSSDQDISLHQIPDGQTETKEDQEDDEHHTDSAGFRTEESYTKSETHRAHRVPKKEREEKRMREKRGGRTKRRNVLEVQVLSVTFFLHQFMFKPKSDDMEGEKSEKRKKEEREKGGRGGGGGEEEKKGRKRREK